MIYFIVNKTSRTGKAANIWNSLQGTIIKSDIPYKIYETKYAGHATKLANEISGFEDDDKCIVVLGGDGTMNEVINGIKDFNDVRFGMLPTGSGNDFGRGLNLPKDLEVNFTNIINNIKKGKDSYKSIDLGEVRYNNKRRLFGISSGLGMDAIVCKMALTSKLKKALNKIHLGKLTYILLTVYSLFSMKTVDMEAEYSGESRKFKKVIFSAFMNLKAEGGGVPMAPRANGTDNNITMCSASGIPKWRTFFCLPLLMASKHERLKGFFVKANECFTVRLSEPMVLHADGEYCGEVKKATFTCLKGALHLLN